jgi:hypothetical protein
MKQISYILTVFIGLSVCNAFGQVKDLLMEQTVRKLDFRTPDEETKSKVVSAFGKLPLHFVANRGQLDPSVVYYAKSEGATVYCTEEGLVFGFTRELRNRVMSLRAEGEAISEKLGFFTLTLKFSENRRVKPEARGELEGKVNYFIGNDPALWRTNIPTFAEVVYRDVYPGIDLVYSGEQRRLKYTFHLEPGADPNQIKMIYDGIEGLWIDDDTGELVIQTEWGEMRDAKPLAYQEISGIRKEVSISFLLIGEKSIGFAIGDYDPKFNLTVDPGYSTYLGGSDWDLGYGIAVDGSGNAYVTGYTLSSNFPTKNPFQGAYGGGKYDAFVTKLNIDGQTLSYSTYLGGSDSDGGNGIAVDGSGNAYVTGGTYSPNFPTKNPYQGALSGNEDVFVTKLNSDGQTLSYSTYLGGSSNDSGSDIAVDGSGNAYVTGYTFSSNFPTQNPFQGALGGESDAFVTKLNIDGQTLAFSTYLGGSGSDPGNGIAVDGSGNAYVTGYTFSSNFPTQNPFQGALDGGSDAFVTKLNIDGQTLAFSTYLGGSGGDPGNGIAVDISGNAYVTGETWSSNFPTQNPFQGTSGGNVDAFVTKLNSDGQTLSYSTYLGGSNWDLGYGIAVDGSGNAYVTGDTNSSNFPTKNPFQGVLGGGKDVFVTKLNSNGQMLSYSTYLGGSSEDSGRDIAVDSSGNAYVTGVTGSSNLPTQNPFQGDLGGGGDAFVTSFLPDGSLSKNYGDVSGDGRVTAYDAGLVLQYVVGLRTFTPEQISLADVSGKNGVTAYDAGLILRYVVGLITRFPVQGD